MNRPPARPVRPPRWDVAYYRGRYGATLIDRWQTWRVARPFRTWIGWRWSVVTYHADIFRRRLRVVARRRATARFWGLRKRIPLA